ncbi:uncharacterized protein LOC115672635 [Syzygium oleosum]|uniref:uncharacterized protein LOC115672635 n=1 Tax=Syzygium oleosum TaxID=219896 RepID=UPI0011D220E0|nr:uncharacterized protein LOC115672635 [Syzygium oleosum]
MDPPPITTKTHQSSALDHAFLHHNGFASAAAAPAQLEVSDIEMIAFQSVAYTSLRDLLPLSPPPPSAASPTNNSSWYEIPIKNPLVKHAALAYLQPMSSPPEVGDKGLLGRLQDSCGCFCWLGDILSRVLREVFGSFLCDDYDRGWFEYVDDDEEDEDTEKID